MAYRLAKSLETLRSQVNARWPTRSKASDGWIGDTAHSARKSDHNPNAAGVVQAFDVTHDPKSGCDAYKLAETLRTARDPRIKYVISNGRIFSSKVSPWTWRPYSGASKHDHHTHISVDDDPKLYDSTLPWVLIPKPDDEPDWRTVAAKNIINWEAARDAAGHLRVHTPGDGSFEVAGISSNAHRELATKLRDLVIAGQHAEAERLVADFVLSYTAPVQSWTDDRGVEFFLRDSFYNRGPRGAANILQRAVGVEVDEDVGPKTLAATDKMAPSELLMALRKAREEYELEKYGRRAQYWTGLTNRWNNALAVARALQTSPVQPVPPPDPVLPPKPPAPPPPIRDTRWVQNALNALGAKPALVVDGVPGKKTSEMLKIFQKENGLSQTGTPTLQTIAELEKHLAQPASLTDKIEAPQEGFWAKFFRLIGG